MTGTNTSSGARRIPAWLVVLQVLALVWTAVCAEQDIEHMMANARRLSDAGSLSLHFDITANTSPGFVGVTSVTPDSPLDRAGVQKGDHIRFDRSFDYIRRLRTGETVGATVDHNGARRHILLTAVARPPNPDPMAFITEDQGGAAASLAITLFGGLLIWRSRGRLTTFLLGLALATYGLADSKPQLSLCAPDVYPWALTGSLVDYAAIPILFYAFALNFYRDTVTAPKRLEYIVFATYAVIQTVASALFYAYATWLRPWPIVGSAYILSTILGFAGLIATFAYLVAGWRRSRREAQQRYALILVATLGILLAQAASIGSNIGSGLPASLTDPINITAALLTGVVAAPAFAYAILRHKALDLGFAINRTLVYGVVSAVLLVSFGVAEWAVEHFLPFESREAGVLVDAGIALAIYLVFHRVRDFVEHHVEKLFFHTWHKKEEALRHFVREAGFVLKRAPLIAAYERALRDFCEGAGLAVYLADEDGICRLEAGGLEPRPTILDPDTPLMVTLRAGRMAFEPDGPDAAGLALVLPMIHRAEVIGVTLLGAKPSGLGYRPDEKEVLAFAAHQVGLDLHALEVERLQEANAELATKYKALRDLTRGVLKDAKP